MTATEAKSVFERLDQLNEFERQPVGEDRLQPGGYFAGSFAGEHVAATEFVIGALFVTWGASAYDILVGLVLGNLLAVLSWTLVCAPIAVKTRLTLYWYLRKIAGPAVMVVYNVLNAVLYCILAGCMITVAASAIRIPFGVEPQVGWLASDPWFYPIVIGVGAVVVTLAILGFKRLAQFASVCSPWMFLMFISGAIVLLPSLGHVGSFAGFWHTANTSVWSGPPPYESVEIQADQVVIRFDPGQGKLITAEGKEAGPFFISGGDRGQEKFTPANATIQDNTIVVSGAGIARPVAVRYGSPSAVDGAVLWQRPEGTLVPVPPFRTYLARREDVIGFWHIVAFAWVCNLAMHLGLSDMALFRYARRASYGLYSAFGMYLGHYLAWICAGVMGAAVAGVAMLDRPLTGLDSGEVAFQALGAMGALAVVLAGWTTANPTLYRAGLALQVITPGWPRWVVTLLAGAVTTAIACSPFVFRHLLGFVAIYGILLAPVGAIVVAEHWLFPLFGWTQYWSTRKGQLINWPALLAWLVGLGVVSVSWGSKYLLGHELVHEFFVMIHTGIITTLAYLVLAPIGGALKPAPELVEAVHAVPPPSAPAAVGGTPLSGFERILLYASGLVALVSLAPWVGASVVVTPEVLDASREQVSSFRQVLTYAQPAFFVAMIVWLYLWEKSRAWSRLVYTLSLLVAVASLVLSLAFAWAVFQGWMPLARFKEHLPLLTLVYFIAGVLWMRHREKRPSRG
jgi:purine-cytosine permease-like protein